ncbi:putative integral membrane zinc-ribbon metal-binding protein [Ordospora pajunii]|uniref:putative integral membrane zinc-ribbon metal-binding protein n=1 Tax=Ordospora pajunii TaxID=3039483 RepID=UPI0029527131|nr:putative integral membrane zinc-ribbon metal-binding protein [Ordospora pajunii]KAH9410805.1 putative integral membrane zinc-ribbon metal-binding protein [Ordospora pajunii]
MGTVFSRSDPLRQSLMKLEEQISRKEKKLKGIRISQGRLMMRSGVVSIAVVATCVLYSYAEEQSLLLVAVGSGFMCYSVSYFAKCLYRMRAMRIEAELEEMRDAQKEKIDMLKNDKSFEATKRLIDKYESESERRSYFEGVKQRKKRMIDSVADIVLGDDPGTMYALICKKCRYHNGLVHPSEYDLNEFYCYNCNELNIRSASKSADVKNINGK